MNRIQSTEIRTPIHTNYWSTAPFILLTLVSWIRGVIHALSADGGAESIIGIRLVDFSLDARKIIIALFTLWGWSQILFAFIAGIVILKYRSLIPFFWILYWLEVLGRAFFAAHQPFITILASGAAENVLFIMMIPVFFLLSIKKPPHSSTTSSTETNEPMEEIATITSSASSSRPAF